MRGPENTFIAGVHKYLPEEIERTKMHNEYTAGIADVWYDGPGADLWVEYKYLKLPTRPSTPVSLTNGKVPPLTPLQQHWLRKRHANGRQVGVIVGSTQGGVWFPGITWEVTLTVQAFEEKLQTRRDLANLITLLTTRCRP